MSIEASRGRWLAAGSRELAPSAERQVAARCLESFRPTSAHALDSKRRIIDFLLAREDALLRSSLEGHLTASALILDARGERALLLLHTKLGRWLQPGGHCDGDANLPAVALREATEETGIEGLVIDPLPVDLDIHGIPARAGVPAHLHFDTRFRIQAPPGARGRGNHESRALDWFRPAQLKELSSDESVRRLLRLGMSDSQGQEG